MGGRGSARARALQLSPEARRLSHGSRAQRTGSCRCRTAPDGRALVDWEWGVRDAERVDPHDGVGEAVGVGGTEGAPEPVGGAGAGGGRRAEDERPPPAPPLAASPLPWYCAEGGPLRPLLARAA